jgi:hypothetical protein
MSGLIALGLPGVSRRAKIDPIHRSVSEAKMINGPYA